MIRVALLLASLGCCLPGFARAQVTEADRRVAQGHFERGTVAYERGDYAEAEAEFRASYALTQHPDLLYNLYTAAERGGRLVPAAEALEGYLSDGTPEAPRREALTIRLARLRERIAEEQATAAAADAERAEAGERLEAEQRERAAAERGAEAERDARLAQGRGARETADTLTLIGAVTLGAAGATAILFGSFAGLSETEDEALAARCGRDVGRFCRTEDVEALAQWNIAADASWITAAGLGAAGIVFLVVGAALRPSDPAPTAWVVPVLGPSFAGVRAGGTL